MCACVRAYLLMQCSAVQSSARNHCIHHTTPYCILFYFMRCRCWCCAFSFCADDTHFSEAR